MLGRKRKLKANPENLTPTQLLAYEAIVASCRAEDPPVQDGWIVNVLGFLLFTFIVTAGGIFNWFGY